MEFSRKTPGIHGLNVRRWIIYGVAYGRTRYSSDGILKLPIWTSRWAARSQHSELQGDNVRLAPSCRDPGNFRALFVFAFFIFSLLFSNLIPKFENPSIGCPVHGKPELGYNPQPLNNTYVVGRKCCRVEASKRSDQNLSEVYSVHIWTLRLQSSALGFYFLTDCEPFADLLSKMIAQMRSHLAICNFNLYILRHFQQAE